MTLQAELAQYDTIDPRGPVNEKNAGSQRVTPDELAERRMIEAAPGSRTTCWGCGYGLPPEHDGACPRCQSLATEQWGPGGYYEKIAQEAPQHNVL